MTFQTLTLTPDPPVKGALATWIAKTSGSKVAISGGTGTMIAELDGLPVYSSPPIAACGVTNLTLPLGVGQVNIAAFDCSATAPLAPNTPASITAGVTLGGTIPQGKFSLIFK